MRVEVIIHEDGIFVPKGLSGLHKLVPDAELGEVLRAMASSSPAEKAAEALRGTQG